MPYRIATNGFGRIGRNYLRVLIGQGLFDGGFQVVAINDLWDSATLAHLLEYDSTFGRLGLNVGHDDGALSVGGHRIATYADGQPDEREYESLPCQAATG